MSKQWFIVTLQNYKKEGFSLLFGAFLIVLLFFITAYGNQMEAMEFFQLVFALKYKTPAFVGLYIGLVTLLVIIPVRYIEFFQINQYKEFVLRINDKKKCNAMIARYVLFLVLAEFLAVWVCMGVMSLFLPKNGTDILPILTIFMVYVLLTYGIAIGYYYLKGDNMT